MNEQHEKDAKDELEFATNWHRAFHHVFREIKWLNAFGVLNEIAAKKILKKYMKEHFVLKDNVLDKSFAKYVESQEFVKRPNVQKF